MKLISYRQWILGVLATVLLLAAASAGIMALTDDFGVFRNTGGRVLAIYYADRTGKFLLNRKYVPANFDALLIGPSNGVNWNPQIIAEGTGLRMYNESLEGGNATEEKFLVEQAVPDAHLRVALIVLFPTMVTSHEYYEGLDKASWVTTLGSLPVYTQTILSLMTSRGIIVTSKQHSSADGSHEMRTLRLAPGEWKLNVQFGVDADPASLRNLRTMIQELKQHGTRVVYVLPPVYEPLQARNAAQLARFRAEMKSALPPCEWIDLQSAEYAAYRSNPNNYIDGAHMTEEGARAISRILNARLLSVLSGPN